MEGRRQRDIHYMYILLEQSQIHAYAHIFLLSKDAILDAFMILLPFANHDGFDLVINL